MRCMNTAANNGGALPGYDAILLLGFGGPSRPEEIRPFLDRVLAGRPIPPARYEAVVTHYTMLGGRSPYNELTQRQADAIALALRSRGIETPVEVAYRNAAPFVEDVMRRLAQQQAESICGIVLAPHQSAASWGKYVQGIEDARQRIGPTAPQAHYIEPYFDDPLFVRANAECVWEALGRLGRADFRGVRLIFTAHSIPVAASGADIYVQQIRRSAELIASVVCAPEWGIAFQSRSGSPNEPWLEPEVRDLLRQLPGCGVREAVVVPIGFLCDHIEVLYDLDIDARGVASDAGVCMERAATVSDHPLFIQMLVERVIGSIQRLHSVRA